MKSNRRHVKQRHVREMRCFTVEMAGGGCEGRRCCETTVAPMLAYGRLGGAGGLLGNVIEGFHCGAVLLGNIIESFHGGAVFLVTVIAGFKGGAVFLGNAIAGGDAMYWWLPGGAMLSANAFASFHGGAVLLGNVVQWCYWGMSLQVSMVARSYWGIQLQVVKRNVMVVSRWRWVAGSGAVSLGNAVEGFHGGAALLGNASGGCQTHCNGVLQGAMGCRWCRCAFRQFNKEIADFKRKKPESRGFNRKVLRK